MTKLCECGCGAPAPIATTTHLRRGYQKGKPRRFVSGHNIKRNTSLVRYIVDPETDCWVWQRAIDGAGYGKLLVHANGNATNHVAHRWYYERSKGPIPEGLHIDHLCRNKLCVNPEHLEAVTCAENLRRGIRTKLDPDAVREIRSAPSSSVFELAERYGVTVGYVRNLRAPSRSAWRDIA